MDELVNNLSAKRRHCYVHKTIVCRYDVTPTCKKITVCRYDVTLECQLELAVFLWPIKTEMASVLYNNRDYTTSVQENQHS